MYVLRTIFHMKWNKKKILPLLGGFAVGVINGFLGAGGGMLAVPLLKQQGLAQKNAHASAIAVIFPLTLLSAALYLGAGKVNLHATLPYLPMGTLGALFGVWLLPRLPDQLLRKIFALFMLWAGFRMFKR